MDTALPPVDADFLASVPQAAQIDEVELLGMRDKAIFAYGAGDQKALDDLLKRIQVIVDRHPRNLTIASAANVAHYAVNFQRRKLMRGRASGWL